MGKSRNRIYTNGEITIYWRATECIHSTICFAELRSVFDPQKRPWVNPQGGTTAQIKDIIERCPTAALTFSWNDSNRNASETSKKLFTGNIDDYFEPQEASKTTVTIRPNGPIVISGEFTVEDYSGQTMRPMKIMSVCRCGQSSNMPYCDGTHFARGFKD